MNSRLMKVSVDRRSGKSQYFSEMSSQNSPLSKKYLSGITYTISELLKYVY